MTFSRSKAGNTPARPPRQAFVLEPRMMFDADADAVATADAVAAQVIAPTDSAPGVDATPAHGTVTINEGETGFAAVDLFSKVTVSTDTGTDSSGKELTELVITVDRAGANQVLMIDGSEIALKPTTTGSDSTLDNGYSYKVTVSGNTTTITLSIASSEAYQPADVATLIDGIAYKPLDSTVASGDVTVTLKSLRDQDATATLDIHATVTVDNKINVPPALSGSILQEAEAFTAGTLAKAKEIAYSADGSHVYTAGSDNTITVFSVDSTWRLTQQQSLVVEDLGTVNHLVVSADGKSVYTIAGNGNLIQLSVNDGELAYVSTTKMEGGGSTGGLAISDDGKQVYVDASSNSGREVYVYNRDADGALTQVQKLDAHRNGMIATSGDYVYVIHSGASFIAPHEIKVYQRNATTGTLTLIDDLILTKTGQSAVDYALTTSNDGTQLYAATTTGTLNVYAVGENGSLTLTGSSTGTTNGGDIAVSADGNSILISGNGISRY